MKIMTIGMIAALAISTPAFAQSQGTPRSGTNSPTADADNTNPSSCLGEERASRNSNGGNRAQGVFGQDQSTLARRQAQDGTQGGFGQQTLQPFLDACPNGPGSMNDDSDD